MEIKIFGHADGYRGLYFVPMEEWSQFFRRHNWHTFHPFSVEFEGDWIMGGVEVEIIILGLGFQLRWNYARTGVVEDIKRRIAEIDGV